MTDVLNINLWGRNFSLPVEYDCYAGEMISDEQRKALQVFSCHSEWLDKAKSAVEKYCKESVMADCENTKKDNPFSYIKPEFLFVHRDKKRPRVLLVCKYRYDIEHGLAVVFSADGDISVGPQDIIL